MSETNYNKGQVAGEILGQRCKELQTKYDTLKASHENLLEAGNEFIKTFIPYDKESICFRTYKKLEQTLKEAENL